MNSTAQKFMNFIAQLHELEVHEHKVLHLLMMQSDSNLVNRFLRVENILKKEDNIYSEISEEITGLDFSLFPITKGLQPGGVG